MISSQKLKLRLTFDFLDLPSKVIETYSNNLKVSDSWTVRYPSHNLNNRLRVCTIIGCFRSSIGRYSDPHCSSEKKHFYFKILVRERYLSSSSSDDQSSSSEENTTSRPHLVRFDDFSIYNRFHNPCQICLIKRLDPGDTSNQAKI